MALSAVVGRPAARDPATRLLGRSQWVGGSHPGGRAPSLGSTTNNRVAPPLERHSRALLPPRPPPHTTNGSQGCQEARRQEARGQGAGGNWRQEEEAHQDQGALARTPAAVRTLTYCAGRVLQDLHLQGAEAGPPGHGHQLQGHVHHVRPPARLALPGRALSPSTRAGTRSSTTSSRRSPPRPPSWPATTRSRR